MERILRRSRCLTMKAVNPTRRLRVLCGLVLSCLAVSLPSLGTAAEQTVEVSVIVRLASGAIALEHHMVPLASLPQELARLSESRDVIAVGQSQQRSLLEPTTTTVNDPLSGSQWGWQRLGGSELLDLGNGQGITVAVLDTGVDAAHPDLGGRVLTGWDSMDSSGDGRRDPNGHGTHVAGIIAATVNNDLGVSGVSAGVTILPVRVLDASGQGDDDELAYGIIWAVDNGAHIINMSIGGAVPSTLLEGAIDYALQRDVLIVVAAGNDGAFANEPSYPAAYRQVLAVAATDSSDRRAIFSNSGPYVDISAPGSWIVSTWTAGRYQSSSGTSMAAPFVAAAAALIQARTGVRGSALANRLTGGAIDLGAPGWDEYFGAGLVNPLSELGRQPSPVPTENRTPVLPGLPALPRLTLPELPELTRPPMPTVPALRPPTLPSVEVPPSPTLPLPSLTGPPLIERPALPSLPSTPKSDTPRAALDPRTEIRMKVTTRRVRGGQRIEVQLLGPRALVARQRLVVTMGGANRRALTDWNGRAIVLLNAPPTSLLVELPGSGVIRPSRVLLDVSR